MSFSKLFKTIIIFISSSIFWQLKCHFCWREVVSLETVIFLIAFFVNCFFAFFGDIAAHCPYLLCFCLSFLLKEVKHGLSSSPLYHPVIPNPLYKSLCGDIHYYHKMILPMKIHRPFSTIFMGTISSHATAAASAAVCLCV